MSLSERVRAAREAMEHPDGRKFRQADLADVLGVSPQAVQQWESGNTAPRMARLKAIARLSGVDEAWLVTGRGDQWGSDFANEAVGDGEGELASARMIKRVPLISWVQAGAWSQVEDPYALGDAAEWIPVYSKIGNHAFALKVFGDSMLNPYGAPSFPPGTTIVVDPEVEARNGHFVIARTDLDSEATFKQLVIEGTHQYLMPLNPRYPRLDVEERAMICGVVVAIAQLQLV